MWSKLFTYFIEGRSLSRNKEVLNLVREFMEHFLGGSAPLRQLVKQLRWEDLYLSSSCLGKCRKFFADQLLQGNIAERHYYYYLGSGLFISWWINLFTNGASQNELLSKKSPMHKIRNSFIGFSFRLELKQQSWTLAAFILIVISWEWKALQKCKRGH